MQRIKLKMTTERLYNISLTESQVKKVLDIIGEVKDENGNLMKDVIADAKFEMPNMSGREIARFLRTDFIYRHKRTKEIVKLKSLPYDGLIKYESNGEIIEFAKDEFIRLYERMN